MPKAPVVLFLGAGASADIGFPTTKQFLKNIGLDPYNENLLNTNFRGRANLLHRAYQKTQIKDIEGVYNFLRAYENVPEIQLMSERFQETKNQEGIRQLRRYLYEISSLEVTINDILHKSYDYLSKDHEERAAKFYAPLFNLLLNDNVIGDLIELPIFTTNYDVVIENMFEMPFILNKYDVTDGFKLEKTGQWIFDESELNRLGYADKPLIKLYKLHGSMNWAIRKNDNELVKFPGISVVDHAGFDSPVIAYPGEHEIKKGSKLELLNAHFKQVLKKAEICIVIGFSFRDYVGINLLFEECMRNNEKLFVEISDLRPYKDLRDTADLFDKFTGRYEYHRGGTEKIVEQLRSKYKNITPARVSELNRQEKYPIKNIHDPNLKFRKLIDSNIWHWCTNCSNWPKEFGSYSERKSHQIPPSGDLCTECLAKERSKNCNREEKS